MVRSSVAYQIARKIATPVARTYYHVTCDGKTTVSGSKFRRLVSPLNQARRTRCDKCLRRAGFIEFCWDDTNESLLAFRQRMFENTPGSHFTWRLARPILIVVLTIGCGVLGLILWDHFWNPYMRTACNFGSVIGLVVAVAVTMVLNRHLTLDYRRFR